MTTSKNIKFITIKCIEKRSKKLLEEAFDATFRICNKAGFVIKTLHVDPEFKPLEEDMIDESDDIQMNHLEGNRDVELNLAAAQEHAPEIERCIQTVEE